MAPTYRGVEEIEGRSYKEYVYNRVPASSSSAVYEPSNPQKDTSQLDIGAKVTGSSFGIRKHPDATMTEKSSTFFQYIAAAAANLSIVMAGAMLAWTSPILPKLKNADSPDNPLGISITDDEGSWVGSLVPLGAIFGSFAAGNLVERWGRKRSLLISAVPFLIGWILIGSATHLVQIIVARVIFGFALAFPFTAVPMYVGEIAETSIRGALGSFLQLFITFGLLYSYAIGPYVSYLMLAIVCGCLPIIFVLCFAMMPESPYFLISQGKREEAEIALVTLRNKTLASVKQEADDIQLIIDEANSSETSVWDLFRVKANFKALLYTCALVSFQQLTGINVVLFYMENIFIAAGTDLSTSLSTIIVGVIQVLASFVTPFVVDRLGRRMLLICSGIGETVTLGALGIFFYLKDVQKADVSALGLLPVLSLVIFIATYCIGWGPLPWAVMGEMFASNVKSKASGITVCICWLLAFFITKFTSNIELAFGMHTTFWGFGVFCILSILFTLFILPETKGKTLQQIQNELNGVKSLNLEDGGTKK